jgi:hypothetical protein
MQYRTGTVQVSNNNATVTGTGTAWLANAAVGQIFTIPGDNVWYEIGAIASDTAMTLAANYQGTSGSGRNYAISQAFTPNAGIAYPEQGDIETASLFKRAVLALEQLLTGITARSVAGGVDVTLTAAETRAAVLRFTGALTASINVIVPAKSRQWTIANATSGAFTLTVKTAGGAGVAVGQGKRAIVLCDATDVLRVTADA